MSCERTHEVYFQGQGGKTLPDKRQWQSGVAPTPRELESRILLLYYATILLQKGLDAKERTTHPKSNKTTHKFDWRNQ